MKHLTDHGQRGDGGVVRYRPVVIMVLVFVVVIMVLVVVVVVVEIMRPLQPSPHLL